MRFRYSANDQGKLVKKAVVYTFDEHKIKFDDVDSHAVQIVERLTANGYESYIVGGAVRDLLLGKKPKDFDIVTAANPSRIRKIFRNSRIIGNRFRLVHVYFGAKIYEVSTFRSIKDGPTGNTFGAVEDDVLRRDFTLNALFYDPSRQIVVDFVGGMKDIKAKRIRPIIPLARIFIDDPVRMIRAVKYGAATGFKLPLSLHWKIKQQSSLLAAVSPSRLTEEIFKIIHSTQAGCITDELDSVGLYRYLQPQAADLFITKPGYREKYIKSLNALNTENFKNLPGETMTALIRDYLEDNADWHGKDDQTALSLSERYKTVFMTARKFVMPMNPPRIELDHAVKLLFAEHGVAIKRGRYHAKTAKDPQQPADQQQKPEPKTRKKKA